MRCLFPLSRAVDRDGGALDRPRALAQVAPRSAQGVVAALLVHRWRLKRKEKERARAAASRDSPVGPPPNHPLSLADDLDVGVQLMQARAAAPSCACATVPTRAGPAPPGSDRSGLAGSCTCPLEWECSACVPHALRSLHVRQQHDGARVGAACLGLRFVSVAGAAQPGDATDGLGPAGPLLREPEGTRPLAAAPVRSSVRVLPVVALERTGPDSGLPWDTPAAALSLVATAAGLRRRHVPVHAGLPRATRSACATQAAWTKWAVISDALQARARNRNHALQQVAAKH